MNVNIQKHISQQYIPLNCRLHHFLATLHL